MPRFIIDRRGEGSRVFELCGERPISIGRAKSCGLILDDDSISRLHAILRPTHDDHWQIVDRDSVNGLKVNGGLVKEATLRPNDEVILGEYRLRFEEPEASGVLTRGTAQLPRRLVQALAEPAYSGDFLPVAPLASIAPVEGERRVDLESRLRFVEHENRLLTLLYRVTRALGELSSLEGVTQRVLDLVLEIEGAERGYAMLLEETAMGRGDFSKVGYAFQQAFIRHRRGQPRDQAAPTPHLIISQSVIRQVMQGGLPLLVADAKADPRLSASKSVVLSGMQSAMCAPLGTRDLRFGLLYVDNASKRGIFTVEDLNIFAVIAAQAGLAIEVLWRELADREEGSPDQPAVTGRRV